MYFNRPIKGKGKGKGKGETQFFPSFLRTT